MALAEARAAWQRTANRCLVQEDAKRAPKLACCPSVTSSVRQTEKEPESFDDGSDILSTDTPPFNQSPLYSNLSPNSRWWLQMQPNYGYQKVLMDEQLTTPMEGQNETCRDPLNLEFKEEVGKIRDEGIFSCEVPKSDSDVYFDSESSWMGDEEHITPWWRTADSEDLALLVAQRSLDVLENCDLPRPQNAPIKKDMRMNIRHISRDEISTSLLVRKPGIESHGHVYSHDSTLGSLIADNSCGKLRTSAQYQLRPTYEKMHEVHAPEDDASRAQLLEALRHSQTRAREAEGVMKQACAEKEHVIKLVLRQASQIFAYKQWVRLLQLENMYIQFKNSKSHSESTLSPVALPNLTTLGNRKIQKNWRKCSNRKRAKRARGRCDVGRYAFVFAVGLGLVGAGLLLGWTVGWMLPTW
ncbi:hypothetical protein OROGR_028386 [Orobanche gracilis]